VSLPIRTRLKDAVLQALGALARRHVVLLPGVAGADDALLSLRAPYRVEQDRLVVELLEPGPGTLSATLVGYKGHFPSERLWVSEPASYAGPCELVLDVGTGIVTLAGRSWGRVGASPAGRRLCWRIALTMSGGRRLERMTGHYLPAASCDIDQGYFAGDNYVDHEPESAGDHPRIVALLRRHQARGPVLEVGCATGGLIAALDAAGFPAVGLDVSSWAVQRTRERLGDGRAWVCDVERDPMPAEVKERGPFGALVLASVLEHFADPFRVLERITDAAAPGAVLVVTTTNADSLSHWLFGPEWEGYFDWTHLGVDRVGARSLRAELPRLGWRVLELETHAVWDGCADPTRATLREWWAADARFRRLLAERDLGDLLTCVAVKA
jgi:SAM-dependent methyltransferase